ncbi:sporulation protein YjcZ [Peribacillus muralis]|uniref:sporulation protein YjcZ n=1 Tax=Peribacillus muralis TaxID=264697 RepID=UPI001F4D3F47|nr:sporulation protein YjcZ [Peribacillus muralis]MCK1991595.1 sporulation protein YjcZ [Peribacillus muralis]MCK2012154.1 sporulation protein YjcZ [Peribacillus muralis]
MGYNHGPYGCGNYGHSALPPSYGGYGYGYGLFIVLLIALLLFGCCWFPGYGYGGQSPCC